MTRIIYVASRFTAPTQWQRRRYVHAAECLALAVAEAGAMPLNVTRNTENFFGVEGVTEDFLYEGTLELIRS